MKFSELEEFMLSKGVNTLADIARTLETTPQAVSNWKARNQVPHHVAYKINNDITRHVAYKINNENEKYDFTDEMSYEYPSKIANPTIKYKLNDDTIFSFSDILLKLTQQIKVIGLVFFITVFFSVTYSKFILEPEYVSKATILLPATSSNNLGSLTGIASQFGLNMPTNTNQVDLSSPTIIPELLKSRTFAEKILFKDFFSIKFNKSLPLLLIINDKDNFSDYEKDDLISRGFDYLQENLQFEQDPAKSLNTLKVTSNNPELSKALADSIIIELKQLNQFYKNKNLNEKTKFIEQRINSVKNDLEKNEKNLKNFNERNQQITSPALQLEFDRLSREVEVHRRIFITLKEQLELSRIEQVQEASVFQVLDIPISPTGPSNKNIRVTIISSSLMGLLLGVLLAFVRAYAQNDDIDERKKIRKIRNRFIKKSKSFILDYRVSGIISGSLFVALPFYLTYESKNPIFFGRYSSKLMVFLTFYILAMIISAAVFYYRLKQQRRKK